MNIEGKTVAFLGDSITEGAGASSAEYKYVEVFGRITGTRVLNYGISGTRIAPQLRASANPTFDKDFISRVDDIDKDADIIVVFGGTNDFGHGDAPFGAIGDITDETFCGACYVLLKKIVEKYPQKPIILMTPLHRLNEDALINEIGLPCNPLKSYVDIIRNTAEIFSVYVLDLYSISGMQPNIEISNELFFVDGLHPNDLGHRRIAEKLKKFIETNVI